MALGVPLMLYHNFARHLDRLFRQHPGEALRLRALDAMLRWQRCGCSPTVLQAIVKSVFALDVPNPSQSCRP